MGSISQVEMASSGDVHLYADPRSLKIPTPILFADCEGIRGGNRVPVAEMAWDSLLAEDDNNTLGREFYEDYALGLRERYQPVIREILLAQGEGNSEKISRQYAVDTIYPRFLYSFSDTIVFVTKNPKCGDSFLNLRLVCVAIANRRNFAEFLNFESVVQQLLEWGDSALEYAANQPTLPSALIVFNAMDSVSCNYSVSVEFDESFGLF